MNARIVTRQVAALLLLVAGFALAACGGNTVRGEAPLAQTSGWRLDDGDLFLALRLRNVNDEPLVVRAYDDQTKAVNRRVEIIVDQSLVQQFEGGEGGPTAASPPTGRIEESAESPETGPAGNAGDQYADVIVEPD